MPGGFVLHSLSPLAGLVTQGYTPGVQADGTRAPPTQPRDPTMTNTTIELLDDETTTAADMRGLLAPGRRKAYALAGDATLTIRSKATGTRFTYTVTQSKPEAGRFPVWFVRVLLGPDNTADFQYLGTIFADGFRTTRKTCVTADSPSAVAFAWFSKHFEDGRVEVWHEGVCGRCGRKLTVPESIESGIGPTCATKALVAA